MGCGSNSFDFDNALYKLSDFIFRKVAEACRELITSEMHILTGKTIRISKMVFFILVIKKVAKSLEKSASDGNGLSEQFHKVLFATSKNFL